MKKKLLLAGILLVVGGTYTIASWQVGNQIEAGIDTNLKNVLAKIRAEYPDSHVYAELSDYQKGIFSSTVRLKVEFADYNDMNFDDIIKIHHGPFPLYSFTEGDFYPKLAVITYDLDKKYNEDLWEMAGNKPFINLSLTRYFDNTNKIVLKNAAIHKFEDSNSIDLSANKMIINYDSTTDLLQTNLSINNFTLIKNNKKIELKDLSLISDSKQNSDNMKIVGKLVLNLGSLSISDDEYEVEKTFKINGLSINQDSLQNNNNISSNSSLLIDSIYFNKQNLGKFKANMDLGFVYDFNNTSEYTLKTNQLSFETMHGSLEADINMKMKTDNLFKNPFSFGSFNNYEFLQTRIELPYNALFSIIARCQNSEKTTISQEDIDQATYQTIPFISMMTARTPFIVIKNDENDFSKNVISSSIYYSPRENKLEINGKSYDPLEFGF
ncbi:uncharacterized protein DUF945 [Frischella perrara]|uniref:DUF945 domain-containing protein n=1 Tax=Frischella perrara TaxID=1267021 RepID=A0A0A7S0F4_FRIPE|nr:DUF945 family protein [Frischella perrara]AJA45019.1 hypothetical protein FPB0191_01195 [Frischella perrara]PWV66038.1 uncharacterized protein DUF945 [Frischella perrara]